MLFESTLHEWNLFAWISVQDNQCSFLIKCLEFLGWGRGGLPGSFHLGPQHAGYLMR